MPQFAFEAVDSKGKTIKGAVEAGSPEEVKAKLNKKGLFPTKVKMKAAGSSDSDGDSAGPSTRSKTSVGKTLKTRRVGKVKVKALTLFTQQLSILIDAGLPIVRSLKILEGQQKPGAMKVCLGMLTEQVRSGSRLSEAMGQHDKVFDKLYVNMIRAGEASGALDTILRRLAEFMEKAQRIKRKVIGAMVYPTVVSMFAVLILIAIMIFVVPNFESVFADQNIDLPWPTQLLIGMSKRMTLLWPLLFIVPAGIIFLYKMVMKNPAFAYSVDSIKMRIPLLGTVFSKSVVSRFCRTFGTLINSGVGILEALLIVKGAVDNRVLSKAITSVHSSIREGESIATPLAQSGIFDDMVVNMIDVGEETGELDKMLMRIADNYDEEVDIAIEAVLNSMEPFLIVFMGVAIGSIVIALFLPMIRMMEGMQ